MKESIDVQALFQKAANQPVETSFDATRQDFLALTAGASAPSGAKGHFLTKNWIIMLSITTLTAITMGILVQADTTKNTSDLEISTPQSASKTELTTEAIPSENYVQNESGHRETALTGFLQPKRIQSIPLESKGLQAIANPRKVYTHSRAPYIPTLTEDEKKANEKRKERMVKALLKMDKKSYAYIPSSTFTYESKSVSVQAFVISKNEVSNIEYKTFLFDLIIQGRNDEFLLARPDQEKWVELFGEDMKSFQDMYFSHEAYDNYPVVNITRKGAEMYCNWLTREGHKVNTKNNDPMLNDLRVPTRIEWALAGGADAGEYSWGNTSIRNADGCFLGNFDVKQFNAEENPITTPTKDTASCPVLGDGALTMARTNTYNPNKFGLYNMSGNVAEMVIETADNQAQPELFGTAGGGWMDGPDALKMQAEDPYSGVQDAHPNIGFRVVMTFLSK